MRRKSLNVKEVRTVIAVFSELEKMPYGELNKFLGSLTIKEMQELYRKLKKWYSGEDEREEW